MHVTFVISFSTAPLAAAGPWYHIYVLNRPYLQALWLWQAAAMAAPFFGFLLFVTKKRSAFLGSRQGARRQGEFIKALGKASSYSTHTFI
jgi:hypothetical protein